jgi:hypothetical protein
MVGGSAMSVINSNQTQGLFVVDSQLSFALSIFILLIIVALIYMVIYSF